MARRLALPITALVVFAVELLPSITGAGFHEIFGMVAALALLAHATISLRSGARLFD